MFGKSDQRGDAGRRGFTLSDFLFERLRLKLRKTQQNCYFWSLISFGPSVFPRPIAELATVAVFCPTRPPELSGNAEGSDGRAADSALSGIRR